MDLKENKHRAFLYQFSNIVLGTSVLALLLSINAAFSNVSNWLTQAMVFVFTFFAIFHGWWRNSELYTSSKVKSDWVYLIGLARIVLLLLSVLWLQALPMAGNVHLSLAIFFGMIALASWTGWVQQIHFIRPLYGKSRVMQKREFLADLFYAVSLTLFVLGLVFVPDLVFGMLGFGILALLILIGRPIAKTATPWTELAPPHRGGRRPRHGEDRRSGRSRGDGRQRSNNKQDYSRRSSQDDRGHRQERDNRRPQRSQARTGRTSQPQEERAKEHTETRTENSSPQKSRSSSRQQRPRRTNRPEQSRRHRTREEEEKKNPVPVSEQDANQETIETRSEKQSKANDEQRAKPAYGRKRRGKKPDAKTLEGAAASAEDTAKNSSQSNPISKQDSGELYPTKFGRKRVKSAAKLPKKNAENGTSSGDGENRQTKSDAAEKENDA